MVGTFLFFLFNGHIPFARFSSPYSIRMIFSFGIPLSRSRCLFFYSKKGNFTFVFLLQDFRQKGTTFFLRTPFQ